MHIVLANQWFYPEVGGGIGRYNWVIARAYRALGHAVSVVAKRWNPDLPTMHEVDGICVQRIQVSDAYYWRRLPIVGRYVRAVQQLAYARQLNLTLNRLHDERPVDVIEFAEVNAEGFFYARAPRTAFVVRCHTPTAVLSRYYGRGELDFDTRIISWCERYLIRRAYAVSAPSADMSRVVAQECDLPISRIAVIPNPLWTDEFAMDSRTSGNQITILHVGRLERIKGVRVLVEAIPLVLRDMPNARFVFIGKDRPTVQGTSQRSELQALLADARADAAVKFLDEVDEIQLLEWYRRADICVTPSMLYESFSYTCAQAMAAGKPVVASRIGGIPETLDDGVSGVLVTPGRADELAAAIIELARNPARRVQMGSEGREKVKREFNPIRVAKKSLDVYANALEIFRSGVMP